MMALMMTHLLLTMVGSTDLKLRRMLAKHQVTGQAARADNVAIKDLRKFSLLNY